MASSSVSWDIVSPCGPNIAFHCACIIGNNLYAHGGIEKKQSSIPLNKLHVFNFTSNTWSENKAIGCPALSHHASIVIENRYFVLIGGWDGKVRVSEVFVFDTQEQTWSQMKTTGFPVGAGLSSHTASLLKDGTILIIGREGSTRIQRRSGNAFLLTGSVHKGAFKYSDFSMSLASRSGHTTSVFDTRLVILGGRSDKLIDQHDRFASGPRCTPVVFNKLIEFSKTLQPMKKPPCGRKNHISVHGHMAILVHGGETFDGRSRDPVGEMYLLTLKPHVQWYKLPCDSVGREGHICCVTEEDIFIHGGIGARSVVCGDLQKLVT